MNKSQTTTAPAAKAAYAAELQKIQSALNTLSARIEVAAGDGTLSDKIHWGHVGDLQHVNDLLARVLETNFSRIS